MKRFLKILKARILRNFWLLNPKRTFEGWCALDCYNSRGKIYRLAAVKGILHNSGRYDESKVFYFDEKEASL